MFCGRNLNNKINRLHERALRIAYNDYFSTFDELLIKVGAVTIHQRNLRALAVEMYKISNNLSPEFIRELMVELDTPYQTRSGYKVDLDQDGNVKECSKKSNYEIGQVKTTTYGLESIRYLGPKIWKLVPDDFKIMQTTEAFKNKLKAFSF